MAESILQALAGLFSLSGLISFFAGIGVTRVYYWFRCRHLDKVDPRHRPHVNRYRGLVLLWGLVFVLTGYMGVQYQVTQTRVRNLSQETQDCQREFNTALIARSRIAAENDTWSAIQRRALADWLHEILLPPPHIADLRLNDPAFGSNPEYVQWSIDVTTKYYNIIQKAQDEQDENVRERAGHPLPEPTCGK